MDYSHGSFSSSPMYPDKSSESFTKPPSNTSTHATAQKKKTETGSANRDKTHSKTKHSPSPLPHRHTPSLANVSNVSYSDRRDSHVSAHAHTPSSSKGNPTREYFTSNGHSSRAGRASSSRDRESPSHASSFISNAPRTSRSPHFASPHMTGISSGQNNSAYTSNSPALVYKSTTGRPPRPSSAPVRRPR